MIDREEVITLKKNVRRCSPSVFLSIMLNIEVLDVNRISGFLGHFRTQY